MSSRTPSISIVIPAYNAADTVEICMAALTRQTTPRERYEVILVDDGSTDRTRELATRHGARVIAQPHSGRAAARNRGIDAARGALVLFTDADCEPARDWIEQMVNPLLDPSITGVKGVYRTRQTSLTARFVQIEYEDRYDHAERSPYIDFVDTYAAAYRRTALVAVGGFEPTLPFDEDQELSFRLAESGHKLVFNPLAAVYHRHPESWSEYAQRKFQIGYWKTRVLNLHPSKAWRDTHTPWNLKLQVILAGLSVLLTLLSPWVDALLWLLALLLAAFAASGASFVRKAWRRDLPVAWFALPALCLRAWALGLGLVGGYTSALVRHRQPGRLP